MKSVIIVLIILFLGLIIYPIDGTEEEITVVANTIDAALNKNFFSRLESRYTVRLIHPSDFDAEMYSPILIIVGGPSAPEGTGALIHPFLSSEEEMIIEEEGDVLIKLNLWTYNQTVIIIAGSHREQTHSLCDRQLEPIQSLINGLHAVRTQYDSELSVVAFLWPTMLTPADEIAPYLSLDGEPPFPYDRDEPCWFFWIDEYPSAKFAHPCRFIFVGVQTGNITVYHETWWPVLNGQSLWMFSDYWNSTYWVTVPQWSQPASSSQSAISPLLSDGADRALIINGWVPGQLLEEDFRADEQMMKDIFTSAGLQVTVKRTREGMEQILSQWSEEMIPDSTFLLYITAHGSEESVLVGETLFSVTDLNTLLIGFGGVHVIVILDAPYGSSCVDELRVVAETIIVASIDTPAYGDWDPDHDENPTDGGSEFSSSLHVSLAQLLTDEGRVEGMQQCAHTLRESWYTLLLAEAFTRVHTLDAGAAHQITSPHIWRKQSSVEFVEKEYKEESEECACG
jgi:hypothetical protein